MRKRDQIMNRWISLLGALILILVGATLYAIFYPTPKREALARICVRTLHGHSNTIETILFVSELVIILLYAVYQFLA
jgi:hypothetical protein